MLMPRDCVQSVPQRLQRSTTGPEMEGEEAEVVGDEAECSRVPGGLGGGRRQRGKKDPEEVQWGTMTTSAYSFQYGLPVIPATPIHRKGATMVGGHIQCKQYSVCEGRPHWS